MVALDGTPDAVLAIVPLLPISVVAPLATPPPTTFGAIVEMVGSLSVKTVVALYAVVVKVKVASIAEAAGPKLPPLRTGLEGSLSVKTVVALYAVVV